MQNQNQPDPPPAVRLAGICKSFGPVAANRSISLDIRSGEIHALLGENGAGKTTLMNILYGLIRPDEGRIEVHGRPVHFASPRDAIASGIAMVHQQFMLVGRFTVAENIVLGSSTPGGPLLSLEEPARRIREISEAYGLKVDPQAEVSRLSVGEQQRVEIIKALYRDVDILILDEPTSVLTPQEVDQLFDVLRTFTGNGHTVIFITHKLNEVMSISGRVSVLRDGQLVGTVNTAEASREQLAGMLVGREFSLEQEGRGARRQGEEMLVFEDVWVKGERGLGALSGVSLDVRGGEVLGIAGVDGNGQAELAEAIIGLQKVSRGRITLAGHEITNQSPAQAIRRGIAFIPADRRGNGLLTELPLWRSLLLGSDDLPPYVRRGLLQRRTIRQMGGRLLKQFDVRPPDLEWPAGSLSGGNQQKLVLARELDKKPRLLVACQPTLGLDIRTTEYVRSLVLAEREKGVAVLLVSTDLQEVMALSDRIAVLYEGRVMGVVDARTARVEQVGLLMAGIASPNTEQEKAHA